VLRRHAGPPAHARRPTALRRHRKPSAGLPAIGPGKIALLEAIARTGSITAAARALGMSYRRAWLLADTMNRCFTAPLVAAAAGGPGGGGTRLTALGNEVVQTYRRIEATAEAAGAADVAALIRRMR
jgi:molybdate transport system regulatory protein